MCKNYFDFEIYMLILDKYYKNEELTLEDINYIQDEKHIKHVFKEINRYSRDVLFKNQPYDIEKSEYFYIIYYKENCYKVANNEYEDIYEIEFLKDKRIKEEIENLKNQDDEYVLQDIICIDTLIEHNKNALHISHVVRKR